MHSPVTAHHILRGLKLAHVEDTLAVLGIDEAGGYLTSTIPIVIQWPEAHSTILAATQKEVLATQGRHTLDSPRVAGEALQADLVEVEVGILLVHTNLILPVRQPVPTQPMGTPWQLPLQGVVFPPIAKAPPTYSRDGAQWARALKLRVIGDLYAIPNENTPKGP